MSKGNLSRIAAASATSRTVGTTASTPRENVRLTVDLKPDQHAELHAQAAKAGAELRRRVTASEYTRELIAVLAESPTLADRVLERLQAGSER